MGRPRLSLIGQRYGRFVVMREGRRAGINQYWWCQCDCGSPQKEVLQSSLRVGVSQSCGCKSREVAGRLAAARLGSKAGDLVDRRFGMLTVLSRAVKTDSGGNRGYEPINCRWATKIEQARNRRSSRILTIGGVSKTLAEWAEVSGVHHGTIQSRLGKGMSPKDAVFRPPMATGRHRKKAA